VVAARDECIGGVLDCAIADAEGAVLPAPPECPDVVECEEAPVAAPVPAPAHEPAQTVPVGARNVGGAGAGAAAGAGTGAASGSAAGAGAASGAGAGAGSLAGAVA